MKENEQIKGYGPYVDRLNRIMKLDLVKSFKDAGINLTPEQWIVLSEAAAKKEMSQTELANATFKDSPTVSRIIDILCDRGYLVRTSIHNDRRKYLISVTTSGSEVVEKAYPIVLSRRKQGWKGLSKSDFDNFIRTMETIMDNYQKK